MLKKYLFKISGLLLVCLAFFSFWILFHMLNAGFSSDYYIYSSVPEPGHLLLAEDVIPESRSGFPIIFIFASIFVSFLSLWFGLFLSFFRFYTEEKEENKNFNMKLFFSLFAILLVLFSFSFFLIKFKFFIFKTIDFSVKNESVLEYGSFFELQVDIKNFSPFLLGNNSLSCSYYLDDVRLDYDYCPFINSYSSSHIKRSFNLVNELSKISNNYGVYSPDFVVSPGPHIFTVRVNGKSKSLNFSVSGSESLEIPCDAFKNPDRETNCIYDLVEKEKDLSLCESLEGENKTTCQYLSGNCELIIDSNDKKICFEKLGAIDPTPCINLPILKREQKVDDINNYDFGCFRNVFAYLPQQKFISSCMIIDNLSDRDRCYEFLYTDKDFYDVCDLMQNFDSCYLEKLKNTNFVDFDCKKLSNSNFRNSCYVLLSVKKQDPVLCSYSIIPGLFYVESNNKSVNTMNSTARGYCYVELAKINKNSDICNRLSIGDKKDECFWAFYNFYKDSSYCELMKSPEKYCKNLVSD